MNSKMNRRDFVKSLAAAGALTLTGLSTKTQAASDLPIGIQLYTVRDLSSKDFKDTLKKVADIGYKHFEFAGYGGMNAAELSAFLQQIGVNTCGTHEGYEKFLDNAQQVIDFNSAIGSPYIVIPSMPGHFRRTDEHGLKEFAYNLNTFGYKVKEAGMQLCYHNHSFEFEKLDDGRTLYDVIFTETDAELVKAEVDVAWAFNAGVDPVELFDKYSDRVKLLHMKDLDKNGKLAPVGEGVIDMPAVIKKAKEIGVAYYIVEQDRTREGKDILNEIEISYKNLSKLLS